MVKDIAVELDHIFYPRSVSIIGASSREGSFGRLFLEGLIRMGFEKIYPVHPRDKNLLGLKAYPNIMEIPDEVDLAILLTPTGETLRIVEECTRKKVKGIVVFTAGFREKSEEGRKIEDEIASIARNNGARVIGPNSNGLYCPESKLLTFPDSLLAGTSSESGPIGAFSHSGSFVDFLSLSLYGKGLRFSKAVSCGNECDLGAADFLEYLGKDNKTKIIVAYLEGIKEGKRFYQLARDISKQKPIVVWKGGATESGARAAFSHTGKIAGSKKVWEAMFKQAGIVSVSSFTEVIDCLLAFYYLPLPKGRRIAIVSGMGGTGVGTSDNCIGLGLQVPKLTEKTMNKLIKVLPPVGTTPENPVDIGVAVVIGPHLYGEAIRILADDENVDMLLAITPRNIRCIQSIVDAAKGLNKPLVTSIYTLPELAAPEYQVFTDNRIPAYADAKKAAFALAKLADYAEFVKLHK